MLHRWEGRPLRDFARRMHIITNVFCVKDKVCVWQDSDEEEDYQIRPTDNLLLVGKAEDELSSIEVHGK